MARFFDFTGGGEEECIAQRPHVEILAGLVNTQIDRFLNRILQPADGMMSRKDVMVVQNYVDQSCLHWIAFPYLSHQVNCDAPWFDTKAHKASFFNTKLYIWEQDFNEPTIIIMSSTRFEDDSDHLAFKSQLQYVWYD